MVNENLVESYAGDEEARNLMHEAQCLAGMAFSNALLGIVHSMAHKVGAVFHIPHGCANAIFLPYVIQYNRSKCEDRYADIAKVLKLEGNTDAELTDSLIKMIDGLNDRLNIPHSMKEYGVEEADFKANLKFVAHNAVLDACTGSNPREIDDETMEKLFECTYYGTKVNL
jgi:alcohol dehydrogenase class IV